jgi:hypothetical protein
MSYRCGECVFADGVGQRIMIAGSLGIPACASATLGRSEQQVLRSWRLCQSLVICPCHPRIGVADEYSFFGDLLFH